MHWKVLLGLACLMVSALGLARSADGEEDRNSMEYILSHPEHPDYYPVAWNDTDYKLIKATEDAVKKLMPMIVRQSSEINLSGPCMASLFKMILAIRKQKVWAYRRTYCNPIYFSAP